MHVLFQKLCLIALTDKDYRHSSFDKETNFND